MTKGLGINVVALAIVGKPLCFLVVLVLCAGNLAAQVRTFPDLVRMYDYNPTTSLKKIRGCLIALPVEQFLGRLCSKNLSSLCQLI
jgi:hypothetical protein